MKPVITLGGIVLVLWTLTITNNAVSFASEPRRLAPAAVSQFYAERNGKPAWSDDERFNGLIQAIESLSDHGLEPEHYHLQALHSRRHIPEQRETLATEAWFAAAAHLVFGKLNPLTYEPHWTVPDRRRDLVADLNLALSTESIKDSLAALAPIYPE